MKTPSLFDQPAPAAPSTYDTPEALAKLRAHVWEQTPRHEKGSIKGQDVICYQSSWPPIASLTGEQLLGHLSANARAEYTQATT